MATDKLDQLRALHADWSACTRCPLHESRRTTVFADGSPSGPLMFIGDAPSREDDRAGQPFMGPGGRLLAELVELGAGMPADEAIARMVHTTTAVMCMPKGARDPNRGELETCWPRLREQIRIVDPWLIVTIGPLALATVMAKSSVAITKLRGEVEDVTIDFPNFGKRTYPVLPIHHPTLLLQRPDMNQGGYLEQTRKDVLLAFNIIKTMRETYADA